MADLRVHGWIFAHWLLFLWVHVFLFTLFGKEGFKCSNGSDFCVCVSVEISVAENGVFKFPFQLEAV